MSNYNNNTFGNISGVRSYNNSRNNNQSNYNNGPKGRQDHSGGSDNQMGANNSGATIFPCVVCHARLPTKLVRGQTVKKFPDETCAHCWAADDMLLNPIKYRVTPEMLKFIGALDQDEVELVLNHPEHTLYANLMTDLYHFCGFSDPLGVRDSLLDVLSGVKANPSMLLPRLHERVSK